MDESPLKLFVIVVTYKGKQWYDRCFTSLRNSTLPVQTIVVDNASNDGTVEYIKENYPEIILIESKENLGFGKGNNLALKYAYEHGCDYVFLLNQDAWLDGDDTLEKLVEVAQQHPDYGILSPMQMAANRKRLNIMLDHYSNRCPIKLFSDLYCGELKEIYTTNYVNAASWLLPRKTLSTLGGFDPLIYHYGEDDDYLNRAQYHGIKIGVCPSMRVIHDHQEHPKTSEQLQYLHDLNNLVKYLDINQPFHVGDCKRRIWNRWLRGVFHSGFKENQYLLKDISFLRQQAKEIKSHRNQNMQKGNNWL